MRTNTNEIKNSDLASQSCWQICDFFVSKNLDMNRKKVVVSTFIVIIKRSIK